MQSCAKSAKICKVVQNLKICKNLQNLQNVQNCAKCAKFWKLHILQNCAKFSKMFEMWKLCKITGWQTSDTWHWKCRRVNPHCIAVWEITVTEYISKYWKFSLSIYISQLNVTKYILELILDDIYLDWTLQNTPQIVDWILPSTLYSVLLQLACRLENYDWLNVNNISLLILGLIYVFLLICFGQLVHAIVTDTWHIDWLPK